MQVQRDEYVAEEHIYDAPASKDAREYVSHDEGSVTKPFSDQASYHEANGADNKRLRIGFDIVLASLPVTLRTNGLFKLGRTFTAKSFPAIGALRYSWSVRMIVTVHASVVKCYLSLIKTNIRK